MLRRWGGHSRAGTAKVFLRHPATIPRGCGPATGSANRDLGGCPIRSHRDRYASDPRSKEKWQARQKRRWAEHPALPGWWTNLEVGIEGRERLSLFFDLPLWPGQGGEVWLLPLTELRAI